MKTSYKVLVSVLCYFTSFYLVLNRFIPAPGSRKELLIMLLLFLIGVIYFIASIGELIKNRNLKAHQKVATWFLLVATFLATVTGTITMIVHLAGS